MTSEILRITVNSRGRHSVLLPEWAVLALYKKSGIRSRRSRHINKAVKRMFYAVVKQALATYE